MLKGLEGEENLERRLRSGWTGRRKGRGKMRVRMTVSVSDSDVADDGGHGSPHHDPKGSGGDEGHAGSSHR